MSKFEQNIRRIIFEEVKCIADSQDDEITREHHIGRLCGIAITLDNLSREHFTELRELIPSTYASDVMKHTFLYE